ncbi:aconitate hydratase AcnA [Rhodoplanes sp. TEM]|uniref:Aconitate hydratase n=1 Tax=Rhodoplanes tepidamans TaxID=200616 RepID=A0ABT5J7X3_RHOTP|nr:MULTISPECIES: aconitate hydratase AcnA [Rhodoplanes]MDC7785613.1 aconitate hydratase AcnA [Rhodoplanes tepidamans]MDC7985714.1 aconitate hydratase AcnA [Rhodoplanes sp. TEM]MDQ0354821.1 aconitate hydratase [Rhodoplanes tepidamans]
MAAAADRDDAAPALLRWGDDAVAIADLAATAARHGRPLAEIPYAIRVLIENLERHRRAGHPGVVTGADVAAAVAWDRHRDRGLPLHVERVILPDSSGLPVLLDLAALRDAVAARGGDPGRVEPVVPVDLVVDHSLQVDRAGAPDAMIANMRREYERNGERYRFLKWASGAFTSLRVFPPGTGIIHQVNLEFVAEVVRRRRHGDTVWAVPDFVIGGDSHTPMVNGIGVLGWGVGGIDAESAMLGAAYVLPCPEVVGVRLAGTRRPGVTTTDLALAVTERLRREKVVAAIVEYGGEAVDALTIPERATIANMAPEYGATAGYFPIDARTIDYLALTRPGRDLAGLVDAYARRNGLFREPGAAVPRYGRVIEIDIGAVGAAVAGPRRPQDRLELPAVAGDFARRLATPLAEGGFAKAATTAETAAGTGGAGTDETITDGTVVLAAVTSCTNTSNPAVMLAAGLLARKARARGLTVPARVKTSLAPGSRVVTRYLERAGLLPDLEALGFHVIGYGCTTCGGKSGPLDPRVAAAIERDGPVAVAVLSGNRNFEGRIHRLVRANYIMSPPLVIAYALAGRIDRDLSREPIGQDADGRPVMLADIWPSADEIAAVMPHALDPDLFAAAYGGERPADPLWDDLAAPTGDRYGWDPASTYLIRPPFFDEEPPPLADRLDGVRVLGLFGDSLTTDHISPGGEIPADSPAGIYLRGQGIAPRDFNTYVARRCNHHVMARATFANLRIKNLLLPEREGWFTRHHPTGETVTFFEAASRYLAAGTPTVVLAGREYGTGSSRDWAAKGSALLGLRAVIAESYERIHRANLVGMGIVPLAFRDGEGWATLGLTGRETLTIDGLRAGVRTGAPVTVTARDGDRTVTFTVTAQVLTESERRQIEGGGILAMMVRDVSAAPPRATSA